MLGFLFSSEITEPNKYTIQRTRVSAVGFLLTLLAVQLTDTNAWVTPMIIANPLQFLLCVSIGMLAVGPVGFGINDFFVLSYSLFQRIREALISAQNKANVLCLPIQFHGIDLCFQFRR